MLKSNTMNNPNMVSFFEKDFECQIISSEGLQKYVAEMVKRLTSKTGKSHPNEFSMVVIPKCQGKVISLLKANYSLLKECLERKLTYH